MTTISVPRRQMTCVEAHIEHFSASAAIRARIVEFALACAVVFWLGYQMAQMI